ncbi:MAG: hypothetical protein ACI8RZ_001714 [Myxococcota bacterium]|jgi:hypothetical protein
MAEDIQQIRAFLERLSGRERRLLLARGLLQGLAGLLVTALLLSLLLSLGLARHWAVVWGITLALLSLAVVARPLVSWQAAGDAIRQARLVEGALPQLRSRLLTALDRGDSPHVSQALVARSVSRTRGLIAPLKPAQIHPGKPVRRTFVGVMGLALLVTLVGVLLPIGPFDAIAVLLQGRASVAAERMLAGDVVAEEDALVGDIVLHYTFPDYTLLDPLLVPNSDGTIHAPPGTRVKITARTGEPFEAAALQIDDGDPTEAGLAGGRDLDATLDVVGEGAWRFILVRGEEVHRSADFRIVVDEDAAPVVSIEQSQARQVPVNQPLGVLWNAQDDFGLKRVVLEVEQDGEVREYELRRPLDGTSALDGGIRMTPQDIGLGSGSEATLRIVAYDNDWMAGGKRGESVAVEIEVLGPQAQGARLANYIRELRDAMIPPLADFLVEDTPPSATGPGMLRWAESARGRFEPIQELMKKQWGDDSPSSIDGKVVDDVMEAAARLIRFTITTYDPSSGRSTTVRDDETFAELHDAQIASLEKAIYLLDMMMRQAGLAELSDLAANLAQEAQELKEFSETDPEAGELLARLDQLQRLMSQLERAASKLDEGRIQEFVNARLDESSSLMDEIRKAIAEGRMEDAQEMLERLAESLQQMAEGLNTQMSEQQEGDDEMGEAYKQLVEDLEQLEKEQQELAEQLAQAREQEDDQSAEQAEMWERVLALAQTADDAARAAVSASGDGAGWRSSAVARMGRFAESTAGVLDAVRARDASASIERVDRAIRQGQIATAAVEHELARSRPPGESTPDGVMTANDKTAGSIANLKEILKLLEQLQEGQQTESEEMQELAQQQQQQQGELSERQQQLQQQVGQMEQAMPTSDGTASESMKRAGEAMERAGENLEGGRSMPGEGHQRDAAGRLQSTRESLQQQMQEYQQMQQRQQQMQGNEGQGNENERDGESYSTQEIQIPSPEEFQTPEEYRRALLEGMEADVPEEYEALKKRYYEELVRQ